MNSLPVGRYITLVRALVIYTVLASLARPVVSGMFEEKEITLRGNIAVPLRVNNATGTRLLLWLPSEYGFVDESAELATALANLGIEVWRPDPLAAYFLPPVPSSINKVAAADIAGIIDHATRNSNKEIVWFADGRGAVLALRGAMHWLKFGQGQGAHKLSGAILLSPNLYTETPQPGDVAKYLPIAGRTSINTLVLQPQMSPWYWWRDRLVRELHKAGAQSAVRVLPGVRDRFYFRPDATATENRAASELPVLISNAYSQLLELKEGKQ